MESRAALYWYQVEIKIRFLLDKSGKYIFISWRSQRTSAVSFQVGETAAGVSVGWLGKVVSVGFGSTAANSFETGAALIMTFFFSQSVSPFSLPSCLYWLPDSNYLHISLSLFGAFVCVSLSLSFPLFSLFSFHFFFFWLGSSSSVATCWINTQPKIYLTVFKGRFKKFLPVSLWWTINTHALCSKFSDLLANGGLFWNILTFIKIQWDYRKAKTISHI